MKAEISKLKYGAGNNEKDWKSTKIKQQQDNLQSIETEQMGDKRVGITGIDKVSATYYE